MSFKGCCMSIENFNFLEDGEEGCCNPLVEGGLTSVVTLSQSGSGRLYSIKESIKPLLNGNCPGMMEGVVERKGDLSDFITDIISDIVELSDLSRMIAVKLFVQCVNNCPPICA